MYTKNKHSVSQSDYQAYREYMRVVFAEPEDRTELHELLQEAILHDLTPRQGQCIYAYYVEGKKMREIASELGIHQSVVSRSISAGEKKLRICMKYSSKLLLKLAKNA